MHTFCLYRFDLSVPSETHLESLSWLQFLLPQKMEAGSRPQLSRGSDPAVQSERMTGSWAVAPRAYVALTGP